MKQPKKPWFRKTRWSYIACTWQGAFVYLPYFIYLSLTLNYIIGKNLSFEDGFIQLFPLWVIGAIIMQWFASNKA